MWLATGRSRRVRLHRRRALLHRVGGYAIGAIIFNALIVAACAWLSPKIGSKERGLYDVELRLLQENKELPRDSDVISSWAIGWRGTTILLRDLEFYDEMRALFEQGTRATFIFPRVQDWRMGFPFYCQRGYTFSHSSRWVKEQNSASNNAKRWGRRGLLEIRSPSIYPGERAFYIPLIPIWWGWLLNVLFYMVVIAFLSDQYSRRWGRGVRRRRKGLCPKCTYNLRGDFSIGCPECGWKRGEGHNACGYSSAAGSD